MVICLLFKSHLYGIEIEKITAPKPKLPGLNRTFMELKYFYSVSRSKSVAMFKSHLYGIEM